jgi:acylphosphatase
VNPPIRITMADPLTRISLRYTGRVQGVGFRATVRAAARHHALTGWVRNEADGAVSAELQGPIASVEACVAGIADAMRHNIRAADRGERPVVPGDAAFEITR